MTGVAPRSEAIAKYAIVEVVRIIEAMLWKKRVPRGRYERSQMSEKWFILSNVEVNLQ